MGAGSPARGPLALMKGFPAALRSSYCGRRKTHDYRGEGGGWGGGVALLAFILLPIPNSGKSDSLYFAFGVVEAIS